MPKFRATIDCGLCVRWQLAFIFLVASPCFGMETLAAQEAPVGGGHGYGDVYTYGDYEVQTPDELLVALASAKPGEVIFVTAATLDLSGHTNIALPAGVTLAGERSGSVGPLIFTSQDDTAPLFRTAGDRVRVSGLRLKGPDMKRRTALLRLLHLQGKYYSVPVSQGIVNAYQDFRVDNCEMFGWGHAAIVLEKGARGRVDHNYIHHNQRFGLGYGIVVNSSYAIIESNFFDWNRHAISATGTPMTSYLATGNIVGENSSSHAFDMHGDRRSAKSDGVIPAGEYVQITNNVFRLKDQEAVRIRGVPRRMSYVTGNCFAHVDEEQAVRQLSRPSNLSIESNSFGPNCHLSISAEIPATTN